MMNRIISVLVGVLAVVPATVPASWAETKPYSPYAGTHYPDQLLWGDTHVHSSYSMDANSMGNTRLTPAEAYKFAKGEELTSNSGQRVKLDRPLDFLVVSDHAEYMGVLPKLRQADQQLLSNAKAKALFDAISSGDQDVASAAIFKLINSLASNQPEFDNEQFENAIWNEITQVADEHNSPGAFTALIGYEWTSMPDGDNLHRVVVYQDGADKAAKMLPVSAFDGEDPEDLWRFMASYEKATGGRILAIPHNGNMSNGRMFAVETFDGKPMDKAYAERRLRWEPIMEVTQIKGDGETHPLLSPDDEFADFETWDVGNILPSQVTPKKPDMLPYEYARSALKLGLALQQTIGANPYQFGMIGSSDSHTSLATAAENNFMGKAVFTEPGVPDPTNVQPRTGAVFLSSKKAGGIDLFSWQQVASGYAAVWATENTREAIFDAMQRKEVYATTGPRITVRLFGGWDFTEADLASPDYIVAGYNKGVPMGGDLGEAQKSKVPGFLITALKDVRGANLDRIQIVKGWRDSQGKLQEKVFNVAVSDNRRIGKDGKVKPLKSTVDGDQYQNTQGAVSLQAFWQDPAFDARNPAFYYARVIEIPKPRWTAYDHSRLGTDLPEGTTKEVQDRAYTSPIWYQPE